MIASKSQLADHYTQLGYDSISEIIPGLPIGKTIKEKPLVSSGSKTLTGDLTIIKLSDDSMKLDISNLHIKDKSTGLREPFTAKGFDLLSHPAAQVKKLLSGKKVAMVNNTGNRV